MATSFWALAIAGLVMGLAMVTASCDIDGVTPNCPDASDCVTPAGDAYPVPDAGTE
jgi:hypothetical protein